MRGFPELSLVGRSLRQSPIVPLPASRICVFCQSRAQQPKRTFTRSSRVAANVQPELKNQHVKKLHSASVQEIRENEPTLHSEFEYDIDPDEPQAIPSTKKSPQRLRRERRTVEVLAARRTKQRREYSGRKKDTDTRNADQERLAEVHKIAEGKNPELYQMAETAKGLRIVGAESKRERATFEPFARPSLNTNADLPSDGMHGNRIHMTAALYRAVVETYAAVSAGKRIVPLSTYHASTLFNETKDVKIELTVAGDPEGEGAIRLQYRNAEAEQKVLATGRAAANVPSARVPDLSTADEIIKSWGRAWLHISLDDPQVKLGIIKRLTYLTGRRVPDHIINESRNTFILLSHIARPDPPKNVYEALKTTQEPDKRLKDSRQIPKNPAPLLTKLPNVNIRGRQLTVKDKETQIGRYKSIQQELKRRGLRGLQTAQAA